MDRQARKRSGPRQSQFTNLNWHGRKEYDGPFKSSEDAYNTMHIGSASQAARLQAGNKKVSGTVAEKER